MPDTSAAIVAGAAGIVAKAKELSMINYQLLNNSVASMKS